jgi:hypothetical protein
MRDSTQAKRDKKKGMNRPRSAVTTAIKKEKYNGMVFERKRK